MAAMHSGAGTGEPSERARRLIDDVRTNLLFVPLAGTVAGLFLATGAIWVDRAWDTASLPGWMRIGSADVARALLTAIATAIITMTSITFSITLLTLQLASQQFGPRLLRQFMRHRTTQAVVAIFVGTFVYAVTILTQIEGGGQLPHASLIGAYGLAILAVAALVYFLQHMARSIQAEEVIRGVADTLIETIDAHHPQREAEGGPEPPAEGDPAATIVCAPEHGYLLLIETHKLAGLAQRHGLTIRVRRRPGEYLVPGDALLDMHPRERVNERISRRAQRMCKLGAQRSPAQDVEFAFDQLADIAARALSPAINDPRTAIAAIDRMALGLLELVRRHPPPRWHHDRRDEPRVYMPADDLPRILRSLSRMVRRIIAGHPEVVHRFVGALGRVASEARRREDLDELELQIALAMEVFEATEPRPDDLDFVRAERDRALAMLRHRREAMTDPSA